MDRKRKFSRWLLVGLAGLVIGAGINSTAWFRLKRADFLLRHGKDGAVGLYAKVLRKDKVLKRPAPVVDTLAARLTDAALKLAGNHLNQAQMAGRAGEIGPVEFARGMSEYKAVMELDRRLRDALKPAGLSVPAAWNDLVARARQARAVVCLNFGDQLIRGSRWTTAREFFAKDILRYLDPAAALTLLGDRYGGPGQADLRRKIWGRDIYVVLEDFEDTLRPVFYPWAPDTRPKIRAHKISRAVGRSGAKSEYFDLVYPEDGWTFWAKDIYVPLSAATTPMGIRFFIKSPRPTNANLGVSVVYNAQGDAVNLIYGLSPNKADEWQLRSMEGLYQKARSSVLKSNLKSDRTVLNRVFIATDGRTGPFYVDDIELYRVEGRDNPS